MESADMKMFDRRKCQIALMVLLLAFTVGCRDGEEPGDDTGPRNAVVLKPVDGDPVEVTVELAVTSREQRLGLMYRKSLAPDHGMLFIFEKDAPRAFWMRNTLIELDMIFIRSDLTVLGCIERAEPETSARRRVEGDSRYVLEVVGGFCEEHKIDERTQVEFVLPGLDHNH